MARGSVRKRGDTWYAYWRDPRGGQHAKAIGTRKKDAEAFIARIQAQVADGTYRELAAITFPAFADQWFRDYATVQVEALHASRLPLDAVRLTHPLLRGRSARLD